MVTSAKCLGARSTGLVSSLAGACSQTTVRFGTIDPSPLLCNLNPQPSSSGFSSQVLINVRQGDDSVYNQGCIIIMKAILTLALTSGHGRSSQKPPNSDVIKYGTTILAIGLHRSAFTQCSMDAVRVHSLMSNLEWPMT